MEPLYFQSCEEVDTFFREGREHFNPMFVKKLAQVSVYFTRVNEETWPLNTGTTQRGFRFGRGFYDPTRPWRAITSARCQQDSCDVKADVIQRSGNESYTWELIKKELQTKWFCVEDLMYRLFPVDEVEQMVMGHAKITRSVHEEIIRTTYVGGAGHKWTAFVNEDNEYCTAEDDESFVMLEWNENETLTNAILGTAADSDPAFSGYDSRYIYVKVAPIALDTTGATTLATIASLSLDMLDDALESLGDEDEAKRIDLRDRGIMKMDIIVPNARVGRQIFRQAKESNGFWNTDAEFDATLTDLRFGIPRTVGDYAIAYDGNALRYNADTAYNTALLASGGYAFDADDHTTWLRLVRVTKYYEVPTDLGYDYIPDPEYKTADFGISVSWINNGLVKWRNPNWTGTGDVQMSSQNYSGEWNFRRPIWECNPKGKNGYFDAEFRLGMQIKDPTIMHVMLHRLDNSKSFTTSPCQVQAYTPRAKIDPYVCS